MVGFIVGIEHKLNNALSTAPNTCKSCSAVLYGEYCSACGQKILPRFTLRYLWNLLHGDLFEVDRGLWHTVKDLTLRPGATIRRYLNGETKKYYSPIKYLLVVATLYYFLFLISRMVTPETKVADLSGWFTTMVHSATPAFSATLFIEVNSIFQFLFPDYLVSYFLVMLPFAAGVGSLLFKKWNFTELLFALMYLWAHLLVMLLLVSPVAILPLVFSESDLSIGWMAFIYTSVLLYFFFKAFRQLMEDRWIILVIKMIAMVYGGFLTFYLFLWFAFSTGKLLLN